MNISKILQASAFSFIVLSLVEKAVLYFLLIMLDKMRKRMIKERYERRNLKEAHGNTKNISFQFHYGKYSKQRYSTLSYYYRYATRGRRGEISLILSQKLEKRSMILGEPALIMAIYRLNFSFKLHCRRKNPKFFPAGHLLLCSRWNVYQGALIPRCLPCPDKYLVTHLCYNGLSKNCSTKIIDP